MGQTFRKFEADSFEKAYGRMQSEMGGDAVVVSTAEVTRGGMLGMGGKKMIQLTAAAPSSPKEPGASKRSNAERKYAAQATPKDATRKGTAGSDENVSETIAYFKSLVSEAQTRVSGGDVPDVPAREGTTIVPFRRSGQPGDEASAYAWTTAPAFAWTTPRAPRDLRNDLGEIRDLLQVLLAEAPETPLPEAFREHYRALLASGVSRELAADVAAAAFKGCDPRNVRDPRVFDERLKLEIRRRVTVTGGLEYTPGSRKTLALVGPTGVGKTTSLAKLAAHFSIRSHLRVALVTVDTYRIAAPEQLRVYADIINVPLRVANDPKELTSAMYAFRGYDLVLLDTAGSSPFNHDQIQEAKTMLTVAQPQDVMLVVSASTQLDEMRGIAESFGCLKPTSLLFSKLDEARQHGAFFSLHTETGLPLSYFSVGQDVPDDIKLATAAKVANLLLGNGEYRGRSSA